MIHEYVLNQFRIARKENKIIHDRHLQYWAHEINDKVGLLNFKASSFFIRQFKIVNRIVSRKITTTVTKKYSIEEDQTNANADKYVRNINKIKGDYFPFVYNTDQSGFQYEMHTGRTLEWKGTKKVFGVVQSKGATTHSFTVHPTVRIDGILEPTLFICLQEREGQFPSTVDIFRPENVYLVCSSSGKETKQHIREWFDQCFFPMIDRTPESKGLLLHDAWPGFSGKKAFCLPEEILTLPWK